MATEVKLLDSGKIEVVDTPPEPPKKPKYKEQISNIARKYGKALAAVLFIIIIVILAVVIPLIVVPRLFLSIPDSIRGLFSRSSLTVTSTERQIESGGTFILNVRNNATGTTMVSYPCKGETDLIIVMDETNVLVPCDSQYQLETASTSRSQQLLIEGYTTERMAVTIPITITLTPENASSSPISKTVPVVIVPENDDEEFASTTDPALDNDSDEEDENNSDDDTDSPATTTEATPQTVRPVRSQTHQYQPQYQYVPTQQQPVLVQGVDLQLHNVKFAGVDANNRTFPILQLRANYRSAVQFEVTNRGNTRSGSWTYRVEIPIADGRSQTVTGNSQAPLEPNGTRRFTVFFTPTREMGGEPLEIVINPTRSVSETSYINNSVGVVLRVN